jgi:hypothetical protein
MLKYAVKNQAVLCGFFNTRRNYGHLNELGNRVAGDLIGEELLRRSSTVEMMPSKSAAANN